MNAHEVFEVIGWIAVVWFGTKMAIMGLKDYSRES